MKLFFIKNKYLLTHATCVEFLSLSHVRAHTHTQGYNLAKITKDSPSNNSHDRTYKSKLHIWSLSFKPYFNLISNLNLVSNLLVLCHFSSYRYLLNENC